MVNFHTINNLHEVTTFNSQVVKSGNISIANWFGHYIFPQAWHPPIALARNSIRSYIAYNMFLVTFYTHFPTWFVAPISITFNLHLTFHDAPPSPHQSQTRPTTNAISSVHHSVPPKHHCHDIRTLVPPQYDYKFVIIQVSFPTS
jgi:hypothetical protein